MRLAGAVGKRGLSEFQLTHLLRDATQGRGYRSDDRKFQLTHLLRDATNMFFTFLHFSFQFQLTHLLRDATRSASGAFGAERQFQLTHLLRDATNDTQVHYQLTSISTHASLARCDISWV